jgi:hypothetical protein
MERDEIAAFLEANDLGGYEAHVIKTRHKLNTDVPYTLEHVLEDFYEFIKCHKQL